MDDLEKQFEKTLNDLRRISFEAANESVKEVAAETRDLMKSATTNVRTGNFKRGWDKKDYKLASYIYNGPLTNIIEYSKRGPKPFIISTFERAKGSLFRKLIQKIKNKIRRK